MIWLLPMMALAVLIACLLCARPFMGVVLAVAALASSVVYRSEASNIAMARPGLAIGALVVGAALSFAGILAATGKKKWPPLSQCLLRLVVIVHFISAGVLLAAQYLQTLLHGWLAIGIAGLAALLVIDTLARLMGRLYTPRRFWERLPPPGAFFFFAWLGQEWRECFPNESANEREDLLSLRLADMWMWPVVRGGLPWLFAAVCLVAWAASSLHEVPAGSQGVRQRLGAWEKTPLEPGLHVSLPWPLGAVQVVDTGRVREVVLGFRTDPGQPILWERAHYEGEQQSLVGGGDDFLSISVPILFRVSSPLLYLRQIDQPEKLLAQEAQRVLLTLALPRSAAQIMTQAREEMRGEMRQRLQTALDAHESGLTVTDVLLRDIHPPVTVAQSFQEVISALEEKAAGIHEAESYRRDGISTARGSAAAVRISAQSAAANRRTQVDGQVARFLSQLSAWSGGKQLYQWREGFRVFDEALGGTKKAIFDEASSARLPAHIDLRKVLNPDFVDSAPPVPQPLVPRMAKSLDDFDIEIEGYVRMDQGSIPGVDLKAPDADNLLLKQPAPAAPPVKKP